MKNRTDAFMVSVFKDIYEYLKDSKCKTKAARHGQRFLQSGASIHKIARGTHPTSQIRKPPGERSINGIQNRQVSPNLQLSNGS